MADDKTPVADPKADVKSVPAPKADHIPAPAAAPAPQAPGVVATVAAAATKTAKGILGTVSNFLDNLLPPVLRKFMTDYPGFTVAIVIAGDIFWVRIGAFIAKHVGV